MSGIWNNEVNIDEFNTASTVVTNLRHQQELVNTERALQQVITGIGKGISNDLLVMDIPRGRWVTGSTASW